MKFGMAKHRKGWCSTALAMLCALTMTAGAVSDDIDAATELADILSRSTSMQGLFEQRQYDDKGNLLTASNGRFGLLRPGYFFWHIESPDNQSIIATPEYLWHHDLDLETVTRRPVIDSSAMTPLQILGGDLDGLASRFDINKVTEGVFALTPFDSNSTFERLTLTLGDNSISQLEIVDGLSQRIEIRFQDITETPVLTVQNFSFTPPEGVDLFIYDD